MSVKEKAAELQSFLGYPDWLNFIGIGEDNGNPCIYLYVKRRNFPHCDIPKIWHGISVNVKYIGKIRPA